MKPTTPVGRLIRHWRGHEVEVSPQGLVIDGRTVDRQHLTERDAVMPSDEPRAHPSLQFLEAGSLVYRGRVQAEIHPGQEVTVHGPKGSVWPPEPEPEARPGRHLSLVRNEPGADPMPPQVDDGLDIDF
ncbi:hypothetical protein ACFVZD_37070 [Streptomyces sp. NPDC058287]|uniref:hypothetical protein n=1 Tax=Streptomyces sp. NPDC058287 TaxID=3346423 RepID=UPI0036E17ACF